MGGSIASIKRWLPPSSFPMSSSSRSLASIANQFQSYTSHFNTNALKCRRSAVSLMLALITNLKPCFFFFFWILHCAFENRSDFIVLSERFAKLVEAFIHSSWDNVQEAVVGCISVHDVKLSQRRSLVPLPQEVKEGACGDAFYHIPLRTSQRLQ